MKQQTLRFGMTNTDSTIKTAPLVVLDTKSLPMTAFMASSSEFP